MPVKLIQVLKFSIPGRRWWPLPSLALALGLAVWQLEQNLLTLIVLTWCGLFTGWSLCLSVVSFWRGARNDE